MLPYFRRSERYEGGENPYHGGSGELGSSDLSNDHPCCEAWIAAGVEAGYRRNADFNGERSDGLGAYQLTLRGHWRCDAATAFLAPVRGRANLTVRDRGARDAGARRGGPRRRRRVGRGRRSASQSARPTAR